MKIPRFNGQTQHYLNNPRNDNDPEAQFKLDQMGDRGDYKGQPTEILLVSNETLAARKAKIDRIIAGLKKA